MVHKLKEKIVTHLEADIKEAELAIQRDKELLEQLKTPPKPENPNPEKKETDVVDDYTESMDEFLESLGGSNPEQKEKKPEEIRALG